MPVQIVELLSNSPGIRAETFYQKAGWKEGKIYGKREIKFEIHQLKNSTLSPSDNFRTYCKNQSPPR
jgi:hypothetical protein